MRTRWLLGFAMVSSGAMSVACDGTAPTLVHQDEVALGEPPMIGAQALAPGEVYTITADMTDAYLRVWQSKARFRADASGTIDLVRDAPIDGAYETRDSFGLLSSMELATPTPEDWEAPEPLDFNQLTFTLSQQGAELASAECRQWLFPPGVARERIGGALVAELFYREGMSRAPGVLLLGGSGGGMGWGARTAALLAREGIAAMAVAYFNAEGLPPHLVEIPLEYVEEALDSLAARPEVAPSRISLVGYSKGAELALLAASRRQDVSSVVAFAPGSAVFQGFRPPDYPVISSWSVGGVGLPFVPNAYDDKFFETFDGMYLWYRTLAQHDAFEAAAIPVESIQGSILLISGVDDRIWPATFMAEQIVARARVNDSAYSVQHLAFSEAGHGIAAPPGEPLTSVAERLGGSVEGNSRARREGWRAVVEFLSRGVAD